MDKVSTLRWDPAVAQARMDNLLSAYYGDKKVDAVLSPYDGLSIGIISSLKGVGYGSGGQKMPYVSGQDSEVQSIKSIIAGEQYSSIFKDTRELAKVTVAMVDALESGKTPEVNDIKTYDNGKKVVPSYLLTPVVVTKENWKPVLIDSGWPGFEDRDPKRIAQVIKDVAGLDHLDHLATTHWHTDHYGGVAGLAKRVRIGKFWDRGLPDPGAPDGDKANFPDGPRADAMGRAYLEASSGKRQALKAGDTLSLKGNVSILVLAALPEDYVDRSLAALRQVTPESAN